MTSEIYDFHQGLILSTETNAAWIALTIRDINRHFPGDFVRGFTSNLIGKT